MAKEIHTIGVLTKRRRCAGDECCHSGSGSPGDYQWPEG